MAASRSRDACVVLVEPQLPENIGATARAMANMNLRELRLVQPCEHTGYAAQKMASGAERLLEEARVFGSLEEALADCHLAVGCSARTGQERSAWLTPRSLPLWWSEHPPEARLALVFGREDRGLSNEQLVLCHRMLHIPTSPELRSLNLAQAVLLVSWELFAAQAPQEATVELPATAGELSGLWRHAREVLFRIGYFQEDQNTRRRHLLRRILNRLAPSQQELQTLRGILRQMNWAAGQPPLPPARDLPEETEAPEP